MNWFQTNYTSTFHLAQSWASQSGNTTDEIVARILSWASHGFFSRNGADGIVDRSRKALDIRVIPSIIRKVSSLPPTLGSQFSRLSQRSQAIYISNNEVIGFCLVKHIVPPSILDGRIDHLQNRLPLRAYDLEFPACKLYLPRYWTITQAISWIAHRTNPDLPQSLDDRDNFLDECVALGNERAHYFNMLRKALHTNAVDIGGICYDETAGTLIQLIDFWDSARLSEDGETILSPDGKQWGAVLIPVEVVEERWPAPRGNSSRGEVEAQPPSEPPASLGQRVGVWTTRQQSAESACREWMRTYVSEHIQKDLRPTKADVLELARTQWGSALSEKAFERVWAAEAPDGWRFPGRPSKKLKPLRDS